MHENLARELDHSKSVIFQVLTFTAASHSFTPILCYSIWAGHIFATRIDSIDPETFACLRSTPSQVVISVTSCFLLSPYSPDFFDRLKNQSALSATSTVCKFLESIK